MTRLAWEPDEDFLRRSNIAVFMDRHGVASYDELRSWWVDDAASFWSELADHVGTVWLERPVAALDTSRGVPHARWFPGGVTNLALSCVERHDPARTALVWEGEEGAVRRLSFGELSVLVSRIAGGLRAVGVESGDRVGVYLPHVPEVAACLYACAKLGAVYVPMFSGFGIEPVAERLNDAGAKVLVTAEAFHRRGRRIEMLDVARQAVRSAPSVERLVVVPRLGEGDWDGFLTAEPVTAAEPVASDHPFMIVYTSGTTGRPKGAVHSHGSFPLKSATETAFHADQRDGELLFWLTDTGWIMSPITLLGAGLTGRPVLLYDGATDHPTPARVAELLHRHEVAVFAASPTFVRALMGQPEHGFDQPPRGLRTLASTGEPWNDRPWWWFFEQVGGGRCPVLNIGGGTEAGSLLGSLPIRGLKPCSFNTASVGIDADVLRTDGRPAGAGEVGELVVRQPWPGMTQGFWRDEARYLETYWSRWPDVWVHGDWATRDRSGFYWLHGRSDDTMMVAGKRIGPAEIESTLVEHGTVAEAAAVGVPHPVKGEAIWCFVVPLAGATVNEEALRSFVAGRLGKAFAPRRVLGVSALPRTRNAKVLRRAIRAAVTGDDPGDLSALDNPEAIEELRQTVHALDGAPEQASR